MTNQAAQTMPAFEFTIPGLIKHWREQAEECRAMADRMGVNGPAYNELLRDASQYVQSAYQLEHIAALSQPAGVAEPDTALLVSMATCLNHGFGLLDTTRQQSMLRDMRKLWDEVMGRGYYRPERADFYMGMINPVRADALAAAPAASGGEDDAIGDAFSDFESDYLTDGNGHAPAETYRLTGEAFRAKWPDAAAAREAALVVFERLHGHRKTVAAKHAETIRRLDAMERREQEEDHQPPSGASVSERAAVSLDLNNLPTEWPWDEGSPCLAPRPVGMVYPAVPTPRAFGYLDKSGVEWAAYDTGQMEEYGRRAFSDGANTALRALEQALTQQRGAQEPIAWAATDYQADGPITQYTSDRYAAEYYESIGLDVRPLYATTPQPGAEALRELVQRWLNEAGDWDVGSARAAYKRCADELESLLTSPTTGADGGGE